jgi:hypothetical protein
MHSARVQEPKDEARAKLHRQGIEADSSGSRFYTRPEVLGSWNSSRLVEKARSQLAKSRERGHSGGAVTI